jgi:hypothetical protein
VVLIQPVREDLDAMGPNLMSRANRNEVIATAQRTVAEQLEGAENRELLAALPAGRSEKVRRPPGDPSEWPPVADLREQQRTRAPLPDRRAPVARGRPTETRGYL